MSIWVTSSWGLWQIVLQLGVCLLHLNSKSTLLYIFLLLDLSLEVSRGTLQKERASWFRAGRQSQGELRQGKSLTKTRRTGTYRA